MKHLRDTIAGLRLGFEEHFRSAGSISLFVGLACNLAFVGQVYFWPAMWHTSRSCSPIPMLPMSPRSSAR